MSQLDDKDMLMKKAHEKLKAARTLLDNELYSDAISRAYYAMFFASRALLSTKEIYPKTHREVISQLAKEFVKTGEMDLDVFQIFASSQEDREDADYGFLLDITKNEATKIVKGAEKFIDNAKKIL